MNKPKIIAIILITYGCSCINWLPNVLSHHFNEGLKYFD